MTNESRAKDLFGIAFWLLVTFGVASIASQFKPGAWYLEIDKPTWTPPGWVFGPVWGMLYLGMGTAAWLIWRRRSEAKVTLPLGFYIAQLIANGAWSWLFFGRQLIGAALIDLLLLVLLVAITSVAFFKLSRLAGILMIPYLLWICFAALLNFTIWKLN